MLDYQQSRFLAKMALEILFVNFQMITLHRITPFIGILPLNKHFTLHDLFTMIDELNCCYSFCND